MTVRLVKESDAKDLLELFEKLDAQTSFMLFEPGERKVSVVDQEKKIKDFRVSSGKLMAIYDMDGVIAGIITAVAGNLLRNRHTAYMVMGVDKQHWGRGVGTELIRYMESWARDSGIHRIEFTVMEDNAPARSLYAKLGYEEEGVRRHALIRNGQFVNEYYMSKLMEAEQSVSSDAAQLRL